MKKDLNYYMSLKYPMEIIEDIDEGGYCISFPDLPGCVTCVDSLEEIKQASEDAKREWLIASLEDGDIINEPRSLEDYSGQFKLRIPKTLHKSLVEASNKEGVSMNQYCMYLLSKGLGMNNSK